jgi:hypothetical protein
MFGRKKEKEKQPAPAGTAAATNPSLFLLFLFCGAEHTSSITSLPQLPLQSRGSTSWPQAV